MDSLSGLVPKRGAAVERLRYASTHTSLDYASTPETSTRLQMTLAAKPTTRYLEVMGQEDGGSAGIFGRLRNLSV